MIIQANDDRTTTIELNYTGPVKAPNRVIFRT